MAVIAEEYASDEALFLQEFTDTWVKLMNIDRFDGPAGNLCSDSGSGRQAEIPESVATAEEATQARQEEGRWDVSSSMASIL